MTLAPTDTAPPETDAAHPDAGVSPSRPGRGRRSRRTAAYLTLVVAGLFTLAILALSATPRPQFLDPEGAEPGGARALAEVLRDRGVEIDVIRSIDDLEDVTTDSTTTIVVTDTAAMGLGATERLRDVAARAQRLVVVGGDSEQLDALRLPADVFPVGATPDLTAGCDVGGARDADVVTLVDVRYLLTERAAGAACFLLPDPRGTSDEPDSDGSSGAAFVVLPPGSGRAQTVLVGVGSAFTNETITEASHAGLAVRALGASPRLVWYQPGAGDLTAPGPGGRTDEPDPIWPVWTGPAVALGLVVVLLLAFARGRRLGRLVREPLPVVVRASETAQSRGRLYRRAGARDRAAEVLRAGTRTRLARRLALPRRSPLPALVHAVASASGRTASDVEQLLTGPPPPDDATLIDLAQHLTDLEERVRIR